ncbi:unnamed protein product, partial [Ixodes persulcatus]
EDRSRGSSSDVNCVKKKTGEKIRTVKQNKQRKTPASPLYGASSDSPPFECPEATRDCRRPRVLLLRVRSWRLIFVRYYTSRHPPPRRTSLRLSERCTLAEDLKLASSER